MKFNEEEFKKEVAKKHNGEIEVVSKYKGLHYPVLCKDRYGVMNINKAYQLLEFRPNVKSALNKTQYFMNQLKEKYPEIWEKVTPASEYKTAKTKMLFETKYGLVNVYPDALLHGHCPNIRSAVNRKEYFKNQLLLLYDNKYDFEFDSTSRKEGKVILICPTHGKQFVDSDGIFLGVGCPCCNKDWTQTNTFYLIYLYNEDEAFYKLGVSYLDKGGKIRRFSDYRTLGYSIDVLYTHTFETALECKEFELKLKQLIKNNLYVPKRWNNKTSTETFTNELLPTIEQNLIYDIVSTSGVNQSSNSGCEVTTRIEEK